MAYKTILSTEVLARHIDDPNWAIVDARFSLTATEQGRQDYQQAHIPGAIYAHLDEDLSGEIITGKTGRHPLPEIDLFVQKLSSWGIDAEVQVVVYDSMGGLVAARLWWMLRWLGHDTVAVLDGGWPQWVKEGRPTQETITPRSPRTFVPMPRPEMVVDISGVEAIGQRIDALLVDCRARPRYAGEQEPIDPVAGHIPGAICVPVSENLDETGQFLAPDALRQRFTALLDKYELQQAVFYCGSGVTAAHNLLALAHIGLEGARLYAGSWSEWITDPSRPVEMGDGDK